MEDFSERLLGSKCEIVDDDFVRCKTKIVLLESNAKK